MKKLVCILALVAFAGCSHKSKKVEAKDAAPAVIEQKATPAADAKADKKKAKKEAKEASAAVATEAAPAAETAPAAPASDELGPIEGTEKSSVSCTKKGETRKITVLTIKTGGCGVVYNKAGADKTMAVAKYSLDHCDNVSNKIKGNLEGAGFDCGGAPTEGTSSDDAPAAN